MFFYVLYLMVFLLFAFEFEFECCCCGWFCCHSFEVFIYRPDLVFASYFFAPMELKSLSLATCAISPWISSIDARLQSRVAFVSLSSVRFSFGSPPDKQMNELH